VAENCEICRAFQEYANGFSTNIKVVCMHGGPSQAADSAAQAAESTFQYHGACVSLSLYVRLQSENEQLRRDLDEAQGRVRELEALCDDMKERIRTDSAELELVREINMRLGREIEAENLNFDKLIDVDAHDTRELRAIWNAVRQPTQQEAEKMLETADAQPESFGLIGRLFRSEVLAKSPVTANHTCPPPLGNPTREEAIAALRKIEDRVGRYREGARPEPCIEMVENVLRAVLPRTERDS
jgi:hypothetical protein